MSDPVPIADSQFAIRNSQLPDCFTPRRFAVFLLLAFVLAFPGIWMGTETFFRSDYGVMAYPSAHYLRESLRADELPLWNPLSNCGAPFLAQWGTMCLYPGSLFFVALPMPWALGVFCLLHLWLGGLGARALAERWTGNRFAAAVAGTAFAINGASLACITWPNYCVALGWLPWIVLLTEQAWREGGRKLVLAALAGTMQMLTGVPELVILTWGLLVVLWLTEVIEEGKRQKAKGKSAETTVARSTFSFFLFPFSFATPAFRFVAIVVLVAALSAAQLLPFFDLLAHSQRDASYRDARWPMPPWGWANFLVPLFRYGQTPQGFWIQVGQEFLSSYFLGLGVLALALVAVWKSRERRVWLLAGATLFALLMALGDAGLLYSALKSVLPGSLIARFPVKFVLLAAFTVPMLAAFGVAWLTGNAESAGTPNSDSASLQAAYPTPNRSSALLAIGLALVAGVALIIWLGKQHPLQYDHWPETKANAAHRLVFLGLVILPMVLLFREGLLSVRSRSWMALGILVIAVCDSVGHHPNQLPRVESGNFLPFAKLIEGNRRWPVLGESRVMISPERERSVGTLDSQLIEKRLFFWSHLNLVDGVPKVNGSSNLRLREQDELQRRLYPTDGLTTPAPGPLLDFLAVAYAAKETGALGFPDAKPLPPQPGRFLVTTMENTNRAWEFRASTLPLVAVGSTPTFRKTAATLDALFDAGFDPRRVVFLPPEAQGSVPTNAANARITTRRFAAHEILAEVETDAPTLVTVAQSFYHPWRAFVDGQPVKLWRANYAFQAIAVPAGKHTVRLVYVDEKFRLGVGISLAGLVVCGFLWRRSPRSQVQSPKSS